jgi:hypothetical protein
MSDPLYGWQVRLVTRTSKEARSLIDQLRAEGLACSRSFNSVFVSARTEARADALAVRLSQMDLVVSAQPQLVGGLSG